MGILETDLTDPDNDDVEYRTSDEMLQHIKWEEVWRKCEICSDYRRNYFFKAGCSSLVGVTRYIPKLRKLRVSKHTALQKLCIDVFCHSDKSSSIDSNSRKVIIVDKVKHAARVWGVTTIDEQYQLFIQSETLETHHILNPELVIPPCSYFYTNWCKCVLPPVM